MAGEAIKRAISGLTDEELAERINEAHNSIQQASADLKLLYAECIVRIAAQKKT